MDQHALKVEWKLTTDARTGRVDQNVVTLNGKTINNNDTRLLIATVNDGKLKLEPVDIKLPTAVPDVTQSSNWHKSILTTIKQAKAASPVVAKLYE